MNPIERDFVSGQLEDARERREQVAGEPSLLENLVVRHLGKKILQLLLWEL